MDLKESLSPEDWTGPSATFGDGLQQKSSVNNPPFAAFCSEQQQKWEDPSILDYSMRTDPSLFPKFTQTSDNPIANQTVITNQPDAQNWDPKVMLNNLSFLEHKIHQLQELVHMIVRQRGEIPGTPSGLFSQQQQLITADLTSIIVQLISTAGILLPSVKQNLFATPNPSAPQAQLNEGVLLTSVQNTGVTSQNAVVTSQNTVKSLDQSSQMDHQMSNNGGTELNCNANEEDHEMKDDDDGKEEEHLPPGSYEILQLEKEEILAPHTHFCTICGKGFKRDANLRMHKRGHGDEYKTPAALAKPNKQSSNEQVLLKRYSCPFVGCKRNKEHKKFQPLKTILCVKNHYKRTHCDKSFTCSRCHTKKFSVIADLKTHEKHCGRDKWLCSCGTTFSRKDKLFGHIALFQGHTPAIPMEDHHQKGPSGESSNCAENCNKVTDAVFSSFGSNAGDNSIQTLMDDVKGNIEDPYFSILNYDCSLTGLQDFPQASFDDSSSPFSFLISGEKNGMQSIPSDMD